MKATFEIIGTGETSVQIGDKVEFQCLIGGRKHISKSIVYGVYENGVLISCNGIKKTFRLKFGEIRKVISNN